MDGVLTISEVARRSGVAASALRFYEERGSIASHRAGSGHRRYERAVLRRIAFIVFAQKIGLSLDEVGARARKLPANRVPERAPTGRSCRDSWTKRIDERIAELERMRAGLTQCIGCGCLSLQQCQFANPGDRAGRQGSRPRCWVEPGALKKGFGLQAPGSTARVVATGSGSGKLVAGSWQPEAGSRKLIFTSPTPR